MDQASSFKENGFFTQQLSTAAADQSVADEVTDCYMRVFNATGEGEWQESWTKEATLQKLFLDPAADAPRSFLTSWRVNGELAGFGIAFVDDVDKAVALRDLPPGLQTQERLDAIRRNLVWLGGKGKLCNYRELGIRREFRSGLAPVLQLIHDPLEKSATLGAQFSCCWTSRQSRLFPIISSMDVRMIYDFQDPAGHVLMGEDVAHACRRFSLPPKEVAVMMR